MKTERLLELQIMHYYLRNGESHKVMPVFTSYENWNTTTPQV